MTILKFMIQQCYYMELSLQETHRSQHDQFHEQLERSSDSFAVVADYLGRGVFTHLHSLAAMYPPLNTTKSKNPLILTAFILLDNQLQGLPKQVSPL